MFILSVRSLVAGTVCKQRELIHQFLLTQPREAILSETHKNTDLGGICFPPTSDPHTLPPAGTEVYTAEGTCELFSVTDDCLHTQLQDRFLVLHIGYFTAVGGGRGREVGISKCLPHM